jgi:hypothetical protein
MFEFISKAVVAVSLAIGSWFAPVQPTHLDFSKVDPSIEQDRMAVRTAQLESLGAYNPTGGGTYRLKTSIGTTDTTISLSSFKEPVSLIPYTMAYLNTAVGYGTLDPVNSSRSEFISFTGITQNADGSAVLTGVTRGLSRSYPYTASSTMRQAHGGQSIFILSDSPQHFGEYAVKQNDETITGHWTFTNFPVTASTSFASETVVGAVELATGVEAASSTESGGTGYRLALPTSISTSTAPASGSYVVVTGADGDIDGGFISTTSVTQYAVSYSSTTVYTATTTAHSAVYTYTKASGVKFIRVEVVGGGGGGGGADATASNGRTAGGGGAGGYGREAIIASALSATTSVTAGTSGTGGSSTGGNGNGGNTSSFGSYCSAAGGSAGQGDDGTAQGGAGGSGTGCDVNMAGGTGFDGSAEGSSSSLITGGDGGASYYGGMGAYGSGGASGKSVDGAESAGGSGYYGVVIITEYF